MMALFLPDAVRSVNMTTQLRMFVIPPRKKTIQFIHPRQGIRPTIIRHAVTIPMAIANEAKPDDWTGGVAGC